MKASASAPSDRVAVLVANRGFAITRSRLALIKRLLDAGWRVVVAAGRDATFSELEALGAVPVEIPVARGGLSPATDLRMYLALRNLYARERPTLIHHFHAKPIFLGGLAARSAVPTAKVVTTVTGVGHGFHGTGLRGRLARLAARSYRRADAVIFQNPDDRAVFLEREWVSASQTHLIVSSGVDLSVFRPAVATPARPRIAMVARLLWDKGLREFVEAARIAKAQHPQLEFVIGGERDPEHPNAVDDAWLAAQAEAGLITLVGYIEDMPALLRTSSVFVLPSFYGEGVPRVLIEAAATAVPVVTCDEPGCREAVQQRVTGILVPSRNAAALAAAIVEIASDPDVQARFGAASRAMAEAQFDLHHITERQLDVYRSVGALPA